MEFDSFEEEDDGYPAFLLPGGKPFWPPDWYAMRNHTEVPGPRTLRIITILMNRLVLNYSDDLAQAVKLTPSEFEAQLRLMAALKMFELGKLSSGKAAELAGLSRAEFFDACGRYEVPIFNYSDDAVESELQADLKAIREGGARARSAIPDR